MPPRKKKKDEQLTEAEVWDVLEFAKNMNLYPNIFTPDLINARMKDINMNPLAGTDKDIEKALLNPKDSEIQLRGYSEFFEYTNMVYKRVLYYLGNLLSFDLLYTCNNANKDDYKSKAYKKDLDAVYAFLDKFDVKREFKKVVRQMLRQEAFFCCLRNDEDDKYTLQELPISHCKLTGKFSYGYLYDFNLTWLIQPGVDINLYPKVFHQLYKDVFIKNKNNPYNPSMKISSRDSTYVLWHQLSPDDGFWAWKFNPEQAGLVPFFSPMMQDLVLSPMIRKLQTNKYMIEASKIISGTVPLLKDAKSGSTKDQLAISPESLGKFLGLLRQSINQAINISASPLENVQGIEFKSDGHNMQSEFNQVVAGESGVNSRLIFTSGEKMNAEETRSSLSVDSYLMTSLYSEFSNFLEFFINKKTKKFKFKFQFIGTEFETDKQSRFEKAMTLADKGVVLPQLIASSLNLQVQDLDRMLDEANAQDWTSKLMPILNAYTNNGKNDGGRPQSTNPSDSADVTRSAGSNIGRGGKI